MSLIEALASVQCGPYVQCLLKQIISGRQQALAAILCHFFPVVASDSRRCSRHEQEE
jgi:hypothetical protein